MKNNVNDTIEKALVKSTKDFFTTMLCDSVENMPSTNDPTVIYKDITGMIGLTGDYKGVFNLYFPQNVVFYFVKKMLDMDIDKFDSVAKDAIGEVSNIIVGGAKNFIYDAGINCNISTPTVIAGKNYTVFSGSLSKTIIPFKTEIEKFFIEFYVKQA